MRRTKRHSFPDSGTPSTYRSRCAALRLRSERSAGQRLFRSLATPSSRSTCVYAQFLRARPTLPMVIHLGVVSHMPSIGLCNWDDPRTHPRVLQTPASGGKPPSVRVTATLADSRQPSWPSSGVVEIRNPTTATRRPLAKGGTTPTCDWLGHLVSRVDAWRASEKRCVGRPCGSGLAWINPP